MKKKKKHEEFDFIKIKTSVLLRKPQVSFHISDKTLVPRRYKNFLKLNNQTTT